MDLGSWNIGSVLLGWIRSNIASGSIILELGSGAGTQELSKHYRMFSIEHDPKWIGKYDSTYIHAPIVDGWYKIDQSQLPADYKLLLVDGPPGDIGRGRMLLHFGLFDFDACIIVDDTHRKTEKYLSVKISEAASRPVCYKEDDYGKEFAVI